MTDMPSSLPSAELEKLLRQACALLHRGVRDGGRAEAFLQQFPALAEQPDLAVELIYTEFTAREQHGEAPQAAEYFERFPQWRAALEQQFQVHRFLADEAGEPAAVLQPGMTFGDYDLLAEIAHTEASVLFRARHRLLGRVVALKIAHQGALAGSPLRLHFEHEARVWAALTQPPHPHVVQLYEAVVEDGRAFLAMEYVDGGMLATALHGAPQPPRTSAVIAEKLARAVAHIHERGVVHTDLKPGNILLQPPGLDTPKVADFGLARLVEDTDDTPRLAGTPAYMAPEQARGEGRIGPAADIYGLGVILYEMLTGRPPFLGDTALNTLEQVIRDEPVPPRRLQPHIPADLETITLTCLAKDPRRRYASATALADDLRRFLTGEPIHARPAGPGERAWKWCKRHPARAALLAVLVAAAVTISGGSLWYSTKLQAAADLEREQAASLRTQLDAMRRSLYTIQLAQVEEIYRTDPGRALLMLDDAERCPPELRDFAWHMFHQLSRQDLRTLPGPGGELSALAFAPDGRLAAAGPEGVLLWDRSGKELDRRAAPTSVADLAFTSTGLLIAGTDGKVQHWAQPSGRAAGPARFVFVANDRKAHVIDCQSQEVVAVVGDPALPLRAAALTPDGQRLAVGGDAIVRLCTVGGATIATRKLAESGPVFALAFSPDGATLAVIGGGRNRLSLLRADTLEPTLSVQAGLKTVRSVAFSPDGTLIATTGDDRDVKLWDAGTLTERTRFKGHTAIVRTVCFAADGRTLASTGDDGTVRLWAVAPPAAEPPAETQQRVVCMTRPTPAGPLVIGRDDGSIMEVHGNRLTLRHQQTEPVLCIASSTDGKFLATGDPTGAIRVWIDGKEPPLRFQEHTRPVRLLAFCPRTSVLASASEDGVVRLWDITQGKCVAVLKAGAGPVRCVGFSPDGKTLASGNDNGTVSLWDVATRTEKGRLTASRRPILLTVFSPDGKTLVCGGLDYLVTLWDVPTQTLRAELTGHTEYLFSAAFTPDGRTLATGSGNRFADVPGEVRLWDVATGHSRATLAGQTGPVLFAPDGGSLATVAGYRSVRCWPGPGR